MLQAIKAGMSTMGLAFARSGVCDRGGSIRGRRRCLPSNPVQVREAILTLKHDSDGRRSVTVSGGQQPRPRLVRVLQYQFYGRINSVQHPVIWVQCASQQVACNSNLN